MRRLMIAAAAASLTAACGAKGPELPAGPDPCEVAATKLKTRLGPELATVDTRLNLPLGPQSRGGCALVYTPRPEEDPEEVGETEGGGPDQQVAISLPDAQGHQVLTLQPAANAAPGPVSVKLGLKDVTGNGRPELISTEEAGLVGDAYRGLRVFTYAAGASAARVVFDERLSVTTPEGLTIIPDWRAGMEGTKRAILLDGAGSFKVFTWDPGTQRFVLDQAATDARNPKPKAAEAEGAADDAAKAGEDGKAGADGKAPAPGEKALPKLEL
ncbi:MAG: hypothetical protein KC613_06925 [Myxococcales bacterium]|nr:hypothetical protein [Myxococcales bacterium]MCB9523044.1 hypothetical protein [Myxococcales bacterium]